MSGWSSRSLPVSCWGYGPRTLCSGHRVQPGTRGAAKGLRTPAAPQEGAGFKQFFPRPASRDAAYGRCWGRLEWRRDLPALEAHRWFLFLTSLLRTKKDERRCMLLPT